MFEGTHAGGPLAPELDGLPRRALILAGGGLKVAFQAGVLQVWLDEARDGGKRLEFMHADGASGGVFNLAMWCQGMSGHRIAENWRRTSPVRHGLELNWGGWLHGESIFTMQRFRTRVLHDTWGLDWQRIQACSASATFNVFDVSAQRLATLPPAQMSEDLLVAATSLPGWYPPVTVSGARYIDGVFVTDANLEAAIAAGANELWVIWTVSTAGRWLGGPVAEYFQVIEACATERCNVIWTGLRAATRRTPKAGPRSTRIRSGSSRWSKKYRCPICSPSPVAAWRPLWTWGCSGRGSGAGSAGWTSVWSPARPPSGSAPPEEEVSNSGRAWRGRWRSALPTPSSRLSSVMLTATR
jgi:predicted acylesterase/phospholipase RssA